MFIGKIKRTIKKHCMLESGEKIVVGVSGGPDSMALLFVLHQMQENYNLQLQVAHLNHGFRGKEAARDARFVQDMAQGFGLPCEMKFFDVPSFKKRGTLSSQEAARVVRYQFLEGVMKSCNASKIALGHTADDQAETLMMWLLRGTGLKGLGGMPPVRGGIIIRPLIETTREEIETFLKEKRIPFVVDSSNQNADYLRNKLRHQLFPLLKEHYNPQLVKSLVQTASILRIDNEYLEYKTKAILDSIIISHDSTSAVIDSTGLLALPGAIQLRCLRSVLEKVKGNLKRISSTHLNDILKIVLNDKPYKVLQLPEGISVEKSYQQLAALSLLHHCTSRLRQD
jgi:tRNA(Ile)-lysidine synthase